MTSSVLYLVTHLKPFCISFFKSSTNENPLSITSLSFERNITLEYPGRLHMASQDFGHSLSSSQQRKLCGSGPVYAQPRMTKIRSGCRDGNESALLLFEEPQHLSSSSSPVLRPLQPLSSSSGPQRTLSPFLLLPSGQFSELPPAWEKEEIEENSLCTWKELGCKSFRQSPDSSTLDANMER